MNIYRSSFFYKPQHSDFHLLSYKNLKLIPLVSVLFIMFQIVFNYLYFKTMYIFKHDDMYNYSTLSQLISLILYGFFQYSLTRLSITILKHKVSRSIILPITFYSTSHYDETKGALLHEELKFTLNEHGQEQVIYDKQFANRFEKYNREYNTHYRLSFELQTMQRNLLVAIRDAKVSGLQINDDLYQELESCNLYLLLLADKVLFMPFDETNLSDDYVVQVDKIILATHINMTPIREQHRRITNTLTTSHSEQRILNSLDCDLKAINDNLIHLLINLY